MDGMNTRVGTWDEHVGARARMKAGTEKQEQEKEMMMMEAQKKFIETVVTLTPTKEVKETEAVMETVLHLGAATMDNDPRIWIQARQRKTSIACPY